MVPVLVAAILAVVLASSASAGIGTRRSIVFVGGPILLLAGLHARITGYLHARSRRQLTVLPIPPTTHFGAARRRHLAGLWMSLALGSAAVLAGAGSAGIGPVELGLVADWACVAVLAVLIEPLIPAVSSALGRRYPEASWQHQLQRKAGGGWTLPEAVVHLYAPAIGVGVAAALAMPAQLAIDLSVDGHEVPALLWTIALGTAMVAAVGFAVASRVYAIGVFEAVPFLAEATRTLAGPPMPESTPGFARRLKDPVLRLLVLQFWRETPVPSLRLGLLVALGLWAGTVGAPQASHAGVVVAAALLWLVPATSIARRRVQRVRMLSTLPLPDAQRAGRHRGAAALLWSPVMLALVPGALRLGGWV